MKFYVTVLLALLVFVPICNADNIVIVLPDEPNSYLRPSGRLDVGLNFTPSKWGWSDSTISPANDKNTAEILVTYFQKAMNVTPDIVKESNVSAEDAIKIHIGLNDVSNKKIKIISDLKDDGFIIDTTDPCNIIIAGPTAWGSEFGVYEFLERYLDIRWLLPGPYGEDVPQTRKLSIPKEQIVQNPTFFSRIYSGIKLDDGMLWARRNRMHGHIEYHHNFTNLFPISKYGKTHPEIYPEIDGKRIIPTSENYKKLGLKHPWDWNPCFSSQAVVDEAVKNICQYFKEHPNAKSYSLGMNDSTTQCECAECLAKDSGSTNFLGEKDLSNRFFIWANKVVEGVLKHYPDKYFGLLAYHQFIEPPENIKINERIIPYFCYDRSRWIKDSFARQADIRVTTEWGKAAQNVGWYDYFYGTPYVAPHVYFSKIAESYRFARDNNVTAMTGEAYPNFGEGPKMYLALKLQWNVDADYNKLLTDWYERCVGEKAAPFLRQYFTAWENLWATKILKSKWWREEGHYLKFNTPDYLEVISSEDMAKITEFMKKTLAYASTEPQKKRAAALARTFDYYKSTWQLYTGEIQGAKSPKPKTSAQAIEFIEKGTAMLAKAQARRKMVSEEFSQNPILVHPWPISRCGPLRGDNWGSSWLWKAADFVEKGDRAVIAKFQSLRNSPVPIVRQIADKILTKFSKTQVTPKSAVNIGKRLELFIDDYLIENLKDKAELRLHHPVPQEIAIVHDAPWEGNHSGYHSIFKDGELYRMYYKTGQTDVTDDSFVSETHPRFFCYAESDDGIHWRKPKLGFVEFKGSKANNIIFAGPTAAERTKLFKKESNKKGINLDSGHPAVFKDQNPNVTPDARYKAVFRSNYPKGLLAFKSPDGIHWSPMSNTPIISDAPGKTDSGFDSQNLAFWDSVNGQYRCYWRYYTGGFKVGRGGQGYRGIRTATSKDFLHWENHTKLSYVDSPLEHMYTNQIKPYYRAPHLFIGFPTRYIDRGWSDSMRALPEPEHRNWRAHIKTRYATALTEALLMVSRDGVKFKRWNEALFRPGIERPGTWCYGQQYIGWSVVETKSSLRGAPKELSLYATEGYWTGSSNALRRYTLRIDGFVSINAPMNGGELITRPLVFEGSKLVINFSSSAAGGIQVEIQNENGHPIPGFTLNDSQVVFGDSLGRVVTWKNGHDVSALEGKPVRLRFVIKDADLFSLRFQ